MMLWKIIIFLLSACYTSADNSGNDNLVRNVVTVRPGTLNCSSPLTPTITSIVTSDTAITTLLAVPSDKKTIRCSSMNTLVPGEAGIPGCAYVLVDDSGANALCPSDYCNCGGTVAPLLTSFVSGTSNLNCNYKTQPEINSCPTTSTSLSRITNPTVTLIDLVVVTCTSYSGSQSCNPVHTTQFLATSSN